NYMVVGENRGPAETMLVEMPRTVEVANSEREDRNLLLHSQYLSFASHHARGSRSWADLAEASGRTAHPCKSRGRLDLSSHDSADATGLGQPHQPNLFQTGEFSQIFRW